MSARKILIVDDDPKLSRLLAVILNRAGGYTVLEENQPAAALAAAREFLPDLALLDINMPGKDGAELAADFGRDPQLAGTSIMFVTSLLSSREACTYSGVRYLSKPVAPYYLLKAVGEAMDLRPKILGTLAPA
jgi:CheY-like chemotaxis protein